MDKYVDTQSMFIYVDFFVLIKMYFYAEKVLLNYLKLCSSDFC